jgi:hypothetical protein
MSEADVQQQPTHLIDDLKNVTGSQSSSFVQIACGPLREGIDAILTAAQMDTLE